MTKRPAKRLQNCGHMDLADVAGTKPARPVALEDPRRPRLLLDGPSPAHVLEVPRNLTGSYFHALELSRARPALLGSAGRQRITRTPAIPDHADVLRFMRRPLLPGHFSLLLPTSAR